MVKNNVLLLLHPSKWHVEEQGRFKTKKCYHRVIGSAVVCYGHNNKTCYVMFYQISLDRHCLLYISPLYMVKNNVLLLLHSSKWHVEEQRRFKTKKYYHRVRGPVWVVAVQWLSCILHSFQLYFVSQLHLMSPLKSSTAVYLTAFSAIHATLFCPNYNVFISLSFHVVISISYIYSEQPHSFIPLATHYISLVSLFLHSLVDQPTDSPC